MRSRRTSRPRRSQRPPAVRRLPLELLVEIFLFTKALHGPDPALLDPPPCTYLSHVCRKWRAAALLCQQLWSCVLRPHLNWTRTCLRRCHNRPVEIVINPKTGFHPRDKTYHTILDAYLRARAITIDFREDRAGAYASVLAVAIGLLGAECVPLPELEELQIHLPTSDGRAHHVLSGGIVGREVVGRRIVPRRLRTIVMSCCALRSPLHTLSPVLRTLILENVVPWGGPAGLVHALGALAELEVFEYRWTRDHFDETITYACVLCSSPTSVRLPSLKRFVLSGFLAEDVCIFSALRLPPAAEIVVGSKSSHTWDVEESAWEEEAPGCVLGGFAGVLAAALARHLEDVVQHGMVIKDAFVTGHGLQLVLGLDRDSEGENAYKAAPSLSSSSSEAPSDSDGTGTRITFDIPPFNTPERRDIILKALISSCLSQYNIHSITYTRSLSSPSISTDLERRAPCLQALPLTLL